MAWITPITYVTGTVLTSSQMNTYVRDNLLASSPALVTTAGDMTYATGSKVLVRLPAGTAGQVLRSQGGVPVWTNDPFYGVVTTAGDIPYATAANTLTRLPIGTANQTLQSNGSVPSWQTLTPYSFITTAGDLIYATAANTPTRLGIGSANQVLRVVAGIPAWSTDTTLNTFTTAGDLAVGTGSKAVTRLAVGTDHQVLRTNLAATNVEWNSLNSILLQSYTTFTGGPSSNGITFSSIPTYIKHLKILMYGRSLDATANLSVIQIQFNTDSGSNYDIQRFIANNVTLTASETIGGTWGEIGQMCGANLADVGMFSTAIGYIPNFNNSTSDKVIYSQWSGKITNTSTGIYDSQYVTYWRSTAAITRIDVYINSSFNSASTIEIYGLF